MTGRADITVVMPSIPPRVETLLPRAVDSVKAQTLQPAGGISCALDVDHAGAARTRQRALDAVRTRWVAFLDDDDTWYPHHLQTLTDLAEQRRALFVWSWFDGNDPFPMHRGRQMTQADPHHTTMTVMVATDLAKEAGFADHQDANEVWPGEDWRFILRCLELAGEHQFAHTPEITWTYQVHGGNTSGLGTRW
jgi:glycosyltransferase involved in cell wall biosynthesis